MRRTIAFVISMMMIMSTIINPSIAIAETESAVEIQLSTSASASVKPNDVVTVTTAATKNTGIEGLQIEVHFNPDIFEFQSKENEDDYFVEGAANFGVKIFNSGKAAEGILIFSLTGTKVVSTTGDYCTFDLKVKNDATVKSGDYSIYVVTDDEEASNYTNVDTYTLTADAVTNTSVTISIPVTGITISGDDSITGIGNTAKLTVAAQPANATQPNTDMSNVTWSTSDNKVATVENGLVAAVGEGKATITATYEGQTATKDITVKKAALTGSVTISGNAVYGETLTAAYEGNADNVEYTWYRDDKVISAKNTYTITKDDIDKVITVSVGSDNFAGNVSAKTGKVERATQKAPAKPEIKAEENKIIVTKPDPKAEYKLNDGEFGTATEFDAEYNTEYTVSARYPETDTHKASAIVTSDIVTTSKAPRKLTVTAGEGGTVDGIPEDTVREGDKVKLTANPGDFDHKFVKWEVSGITITDAEAANPKLTFTMPAGDVTVTAKFAEKDAVPCDFGTAEFTYDEESHAPEYSPKEMDDMTVSVKYLDSLNNVLSAAPVDAGTYKIVVTFTPANANSECRTTIAEKEFKINKARKETPSKPTVSNITDSSFVLSTVEGQEYAIRQNTKTPAEDEWKDGEEVITTGLDPATSYYVFTRVKGDKNHEPSEAVYAIVITPHRFAWELSSSEQAATVRVGGTLPEAMTVTLTNKSTYKIESVKVTLGGKDADKFTLGTATNVTIESDGKLNITVKPNGIDNTKEGTYTCTVTVTQGRFKDPLIATFTIKVVNKEVAEISGIADKTVTFNGANQTIDLSQAAVVCGDKKLDAKKLTVTYQKDGGSVENTRDAGTYKVIITYEDADYVGRTNATLTITPKDVTVTGFAATSKEYDGNANASVTGSASLNGKIDGTDVSIATGDLGWRFEDKNVGTNKKVKNFNAITLTGADKDNYNLTNPTVELKGTITALPATVTLTVADKTYNGRTDDAKVTISFKGVIAGDEVTYQDAKGTYANADAGDAVKVEVTYIIGGKDAGNYSLNVVKTATGKVNKAELNVTLTAPAAVIYDGNTHGVSGVTDNRVAADNGKTLYTLTYNNKDALPVDADTYEVTAKLTDEGSKNYTLTANTVKLVINKAGMSAINKEYSVAFMLAGAQTRPLSDLQLAPANVSGKWSVTTGTNEILDGEAKIDGENLVFTVKSGLTTADIGKKVELTLTFTPDKNYNPVTATVTVTLAQDTYTNSLVGTLPTQVKLGDALDFSGVKLVTKFGSGAPDQTLDVTDAAKVEVTTNYNPAATGADALGTKTVTFTDKANSGITYTHTFTVVDVLEGVKLAADQIEYNYKLKEATTIGFDGKIHAVYKSGAKKALNHADVVLTMSDGTAVDSAKEARLLNTLGTATITLTYTEKYFDGTTDKQSIDITVSVTAAPVKPDGKPNAEGFAVTPIPDAGKEMEYKDDAGNEVKPEDVQGKLADAAPGALEGEVKNNPAFNNVGDGDVVYENISFKDENGNPVTFANGKMQVTVPYPADSDKGDEFVMLIPDGEGKMKAIVPQKTADGLQFEIENSDVTFAIGWYTPAPSPVLPTEPERDPEDNFWNEVYWTLLRSGQGSVITANAGYYDRVPQGVLRAVDISGNTLIINSAFGMQVVVNPGALEKLGMYRFYYPISYLKEMLKGSSVISGSGTTGITVGVLMPTTGDATVVEHPYTMTPATAGIIPGLESAANARPVIDNADGVSVLDGAQRNEGAVIGGGMLIGLGLLALLGAAYVTMRKRGN